MSDQNITILSGLNPMQREAAMTTEGPLLVVAGAGSGKTRMLTHRIAYLIQNCQVAPDSILAVTFTNKAAGEMRERVHRLVRDGGNLVTVTTFHSFCCMLLRRWKDAAGFPEGFTIYDEDDSEKLMKNLFKEFDIKKEALSPKLVQQMISGAKNELVGPEEFKTTHIENDLITELYRKYQAGLRQNRAMDFDDLIFEAHRILSQKPELLGRLQARYKYFLVDEYQDTNHAQYRLTALISSASRNICVVGDEDQSIYSWRGATIRNIRDFENDFPGAKVVLLEQNYRSTKRILEAAGVLIRKNSGAYRKNLWTENSTGSPLGFRFAEDERVEAEWVCSRIRKMTQQGFSKNDFAVLFRMNSLSRPIEQALTKAGIPYEVTGGTRFFHRREVKDILAYLKVIFNPHDAISLARIINVPKRGIGKTSLDRLIQQGPLWDSIKRAAGSSKAGKLGVFYELMTELIELKKDSSVSDLAGEIINRIDYRRFLKEDDPESYEERVSNIESLVSDIGYQENDNPDLRLADYLESVSLHSDLDDINDTYDKVKLLTLHNAKGLEFPVVFMIAMEEGIFPHASSSASSSGLEEERRLAYVGMTRAEKQLYLSAARSRLIYGSWKGSVLSRFLAEIPRELFENDKLDGAVRQADNTTRAAPVRAASFSSSYSSPVPRPVVAEPVENTQSGTSAATMQNLKAGAGVVHPVFGKGRVLTAGGESPAEFRVNVLFEKAGSKTLLLQYGRLRVINTLSNKLQEV